MSETWHHYERTAERIATVSVLSSQLSVLGTVSVSVTETVPVCRTACLPVCRVPESELVSDSFYKFVEMSSYFVGKLADGEIF